MLWLRALFRSPESKASAVAALAPRADRGPRWTPSEPRALAAAGYSANVVAFRAARLVAEGAAAIPLRLYADGARLSHHPLLSLLSAPNPSQTGQSLLEAAYGYLQTAGDAYLELVLGPSGAPAEIHALRPDRMRIAPGDDGWPSAYVYTVAGRAHRFETAQDAPSPILHLTSFHPLDDHYGLGPLSVAARAVDVHNAAAAWSKALLDNAARPSGAIVVKNGDGQGRLSQLQYDRLVDELETNHQGARNAGRPMLLEGGLDWTPMGFSPSDMEFHKTKDSAARDIALAFGVPPMLLGLPGDNTYANYQEANRAFTRQTLLPLVSKTAAAFSAWLGPLFGEGLELQPDLDAAPALAAERDARWARISAADFLSDEEKRALLGLRAAPQP